MAPTRKPIDEVLARGAAFDRAAREGVRQALLRHKRLGESIVVCRDGKGVEIRPEEILVEECPVEPARADHRSPPEAA